MTDSFFCWMRRPVVAGLLALGGLGGCAVYVPTVPSTPLVTKNQAEITAGLRGLSSVEATVAWAPTDHVFFNAEAAYLGYKGQRTTNNVTTEFSDYHRQGSVGVGAYTLTKGPQPLYLAAVAGFGLAGVDMHPVQLFGPDVRYESSYRRYYGQVYLASLDRNLNWGVSVRATWVDYAGLLADGVPLTVGNAWFAEPHFFGRFGSGPVQGYATLGLSMPVARNTEPGGLGTGAFTPSSLLLGAGVVFRPQLLKRAGK